MFEYSVYSGRMFKNSVYKGLKINSDKENAPSLEFPKSGNMSAINTKILQVIATMVLCIYSLFVRNLHIRLYLFPRL
jgi:hypothetical protein